MKQTYPRQVRQKYFTRVVKIYLEFLRDLSVTCRLENWSGSNLQLGQYSLRKLMMVIATGFIPLLTLSIVLTMVINAAIDLEEYCAEYSVLVKRTPGSRDRCTGSRIITEIMLKIDSFRQIKVFYKKLKITLLYILPILFYSLKHYLASHYCC